MYLKKATTIDEQIAILRKRGMIISDKEKAKETLLDIGYFRLGSIAFLLNRIILIRTTGLMFTL